MRVEATQLKPEFIPKVLTIIFETKDELTMAREFFICDVSVPKLFYPVDTEKFNTLSGFMAEIYNALLPQD